MKKNIVIVVLLLLLSITSTVAVQNKNKNYAEEHTPGINLIIEKGDKA